MRTDVQNDYEAMSAEACRLISEAIREKPTLSICFATGTSPTRAYEMLAEKCRASEFKSDRITAIKLDEWGGIPMDDPGTCETYLKKYIGGPLHIPDEHFVSFNSNPTDPTAECDRVKSILDRLGPIDLTILGIGMNGHVAMNEPSDELQKRPHVAHLTESTLHHPMLRNTEGVRYGMTLGMDDILGSRKIIMLVCGAHKAMQFKRLMSGDITPHFPASLLHRHPHTVVVADKAAAGKK